MGLAGFAGRGSVWRGWRDPGISNFLGSGLRRLFDNFIGRKRDVDGGVLAGLFCCETGRPEEMKLTVTFQTTIPVGADL